MTRRRRVRLAVTMGDPAGIGPEVVLKAITARTVAPLIDPILVGDPAVWHETARRLGVRLHIVDVAAPARPGCVALAATSALPARYRVSGPPHGTRAAACGEAAYAAILAAVRLVQDGRAAGIVTAPISKAHVAAAGHDIPGHTELLAALCGGVPVRMMMAGPRLRVVLVTTHLALAEVPRRLSRDGVLETIRLADAALRGWFGLATPRLAVTGLNPHAGEHGRFGDEEERVIAPAVRAARRRGIAAAGPLAADGVFGLALADGYDAIVCMYHDQGLAPFKLLHFADGVNVTLGLPFVRTSPDHGTAFDIAGSGKADARSMIAALQLAARLAVRVTPALERQPPTAVS
ncbi:MAG TPA: 4-hydroxythreonine-4-phosphate dehydrogenase PdxA [Candidatus Acidoferrales bacterium]|nr:4-hydroxythreonine-4-phosphate dehydrogenase PdxA [Candidatus Acidoferrales bacterium]